MNGGFGGGVRVGIKEGHIAGHGKDEAKENPAFDMSFSGRKSETQAQQLLASHIVHRHGSCLCYFIWLCACSQNRKTPLKTGTVLVRVILWWSGQ